MGAVHIENILLYTFFVKVAISTTIPLTHLNFVVNLLALAPEKKSVNRNLPFVEVPAKSSIPLFLVMFTSKQIYILNSRTSHHYHIIIILCVFVDKHKRILSRKKQALIFLPSN